MTSSRLPRLFGPAALALSMLLWAGSPVGAQEPRQAGDDALRVFLDCEGGFFSSCDREHFRREIAFVNWVREPQDAQVHIIVTSQEAAGGGRRYTFDFLGRETLEGMTDQLTYQAGATDVQDETVEGMTRTLGLGLVRYAAAAGFGSAVAVSSRDRDVVAEESQGVPADDPWNFWVFDLDGDVSVSREDRQRSREFGFGVSANRTTEAWKLNFRADGDWEYEEFDLTDPPRVEKNDQQSWNASAFAVKTLGEHWGAGAELEATNSTQFNRELLVALGTGVEYNIFPYAESTRRVLLARYVASVENVQYQDTTVFDLLEETVYKHELNLDYDARETWGNANAGASLSQYLDRTDNWSLSLRGFVRYRLFRGFSVNVRGDYSLVRDQIYLSKEELSDEDILLGRRRLPTDSELELNLGISYSFGSIFNNAVNSRFRRGVR